MGGLLSSASLKIASHSENVLGTDRKAASSSFHAVIKNEYVPLPFGSILHVITPPLRLCSNQIRPSSRSKAVLLWKWRKQEERYTTRIRKLAYAATGSIDSSWFIPLIDEIFRVSCRSSYAASAASASSLCKSNTIPPAVKLPGNGSAFENQDFCKNAHLEPLPASLAS